KNCTVQDFGGKTYYALEPTDNLIFLTFHMLKHFLYCGVSLRMMMDNALYAKSNLDKIDCARYEKTLGDTNFLYMVQVVFGIMVKYCGFEKNDFPIVPADNTDDMLAFLNDLEAGGWQGQNEGNKGVFAWFYYRYQTAVNAGDKTEISSIRSSRFSEYKSILFPPFKVMASKYPKLNKKHYLYTYYVLHRFFTRGGDYVSGKSQLPNLVVKDEDKLSEVSKKRLELFKELKIM
ncbi:MAG: nucleotidyltransferase family protein, partial [Eubacterium sp.]|nr:nucleotidyltransferase family protein [Eubacterium sp.]